MLALLALTCAFHIAPTPQTVASAARLPLRVLPPLLCSADTESATLETLCAEREALQSEIDKLDQQAKFDGPSRPQYVSKVLELRSELEDKQQQILAIEGPPPKRYSAVGRMRQRTEGMGLDVELADTEGGGDGQGIKLKPENVLPPASGIAKLGIFLAVLAAGGSLVASNLGGS
jgi:hypothetical protein